MSVEAWMNQVMAKRQGRDFMVILDDPHPLLHRKESPERREQLRDWYATAVRVGDLTLSPLRLHESRDLRARNDLLEAVGLPHDCFCRCPVDGRPLYYSTAQRLHACQDADCMHASGIERPNHA
jgi:hypothetical protein